MFSVSKRDMLREIFLVALFLSGLCFTSALIKQTDPPVTERNWYSLPGDVRFPTKEAIDALRSSVQGLVFDARDLESRPKPYWDGNYGQAPRAAVVVRPYGYADVALALTFVRRHRLR